MDNIKVTIEAETLKEALKDFEGGLSNLIRAMKRAAAMMEADVFKHFDIDKKGEDGSPWPKVKREPGFGDILRRHGTLRQSVQKGADEQNAWVKNGLVYALTHDSGDESRHIPQREFMWISEDAMDQIMVNFIAESIPQDLITE